MFKQWSQVSHLTDGMRCLPASDYGTHNKKNKLNSVGDDAVKQVKLQIKYFHCKSKVLKNHWLVVERYLIFVM